MLNNNGTQQLNNKKDGTLIDNWYKGAHNFNKKNIKSHVTKDRACC